MSEAGALPGLPARTPPTPEQWRQRHIKRLREDRNAGSDANAVEILADLVLNDQYCWSKPLGWMHYRSGVWTQVSDETVTETLRLGVKRWLEDELAVPTHSDSDDQSDLLSAITRIFSANRLKAIGGLAKGLMEVDSAEFDTHHDLLNVANGIVDLRTGELLPHSPDFKFTKTSPTDYRPGAAHADWANALGALPVEVVDWMQVRFGQAITGYRTSDDVLPILQGGGENGKSTILGTIEKVLGDHATKVPEKVLLSNPNDHPTELTTLRGARLALIEETPEARHLNVKRLKDLLGTHTLTAREVHKNNMTWTTTHSLFVTTNYVPRVAETDHGTWRRLALVEFPYKFVNGSPVRANERPGDDGIRARLEAGAQGQHEAVLAWLVAGAQRWYEKPSLMRDRPTKVVSDTEQWRMKADLVLSFINDELTFEQGGMVSTVDVYKSFSAWNRERGGQAWNDQLFADRFKNHVVVTDHDVTVARPSNVVNDLVRPANVSGFDLSDLGSRPSVYVGLTFSHAHKPGQVRL